MRLIRQSSSLCSVRSPVQATPFPRSLTSSHVTARLALPHSDIEECLGFLLAAVLMFEREER